MIIYLLSSTIDYILLVIYNIGSTYCLKFNLILGSNSIKSIRKVNIRL